MENLLVRNKNVMLEFLSSGIGLHKIMLVDNLKADKVTVKILKLAKEKQVPVQYLPYNQMVNSRSGQTKEVIVAELKPPPLLKLKRHLINLQESGTSPFLLLINRVKLANNIGAIARTAYAAGVNGLIFQGRMEDFVNEETVHFSMGTLVRIPLVKASIFNALKTLQQAGITSYSLQMKGPVFWESNLKGAAAFVVGAEREGISDTVAKRCDQALSIPMRPGIESLNVAISAGLVLYEKKRQGLAETR